MTTHEEYIDEGQRPVVEAPKKPEEKKPIDEKKKEVKK